MRLSILLFAAPAVLLLILLAAFFVSPSLWPAAGPHPDFVSLDRTVVGSQATLWWGYAMALALLATLAVSTVIGVRRRDGRTGPLVAWLVAGFLVLGLIFTVLVVSYARYAGGGETRLFLGLPPPTAWMLYAVWLFPFLIILVCMFHFDRYFSKDDERAFEALIRKKRSEKEGGD